MPKRHLFQDRAAAKLRFKENPFKVELIEGFEEEAPGIPFIYPKGMIICNRLVDFLRDLMLSSGYDEIKTPQLMNQELWERSELSTRPEKSIGTDADWEIATSGLKEALEDWKKQFRVNEGDGAFYGPKIDIQIKDALGRSWQCGTVQLDMALPEKFELENIDKDGLAKHPKKGANPSPLVLQVKAMPVITVSSFKGGTAKTSSSLNLGAALALFHHQNVLLIDFDAQANLTTGLGYDPDAQDSLAPGVKSIEEVILSTPYPNLSLIAADTWLERVEVTQALAADRNDTFLEVIEETYPGKILETKVRRDVAVSESSIYGKSIFDTAPKSRAALDFTELAQEILQRLSLFSGVFKVHPLSEKDQETLREILQEYRPVEEDFLTLASVTSEIKAISNQAVILHGERIQKAQLILKHYRDGAFSRWLMSTYGNRQTPYNFLQYYEFYLQLPVPLQDKLEDIPRQAIYTLASRDISW
ncbi:hypothetical protein RB653_004917, partial [Dictyostelium firmibasis]